jgi:predicted house-cleaning noncanonical NTP pyrophosphatase (MazG superfamily)
MKLFEDEEYETKLKLSLEEEDAEYIESHNIDLNESETQAVVS